MEDQKMIVLCRFYYESQRCGILFIAYNAVTPIIEARECPPIDFTHRPSGTVPILAMARPWVINPLYVPIGTHQITYKTPGNNGLPTGTRSLGLPIMTIR